MRKAKALSVLRNIQCCQLLITGIIFFFAEVNGRKKIVCFRDMAGLIINDKWYEAKRDNIEYESERIVLAAAKTIKA